MENKKICRYCGKEIFIDNEKVVLLGTYEKRSTLDESFFHYDCFVDWFNDKLEEKAKQLAPQPQTQKTEVGLGFFGSPNNVSEPNMMNDMMGMVAQNPAMVNDMQKMAQGLLGGMDLGLGVDIKKDAEKMSEGIKKTADAIRGKIEKKKTKKSNDEATKKKTSDEKSKKQSKK